MGSQTMSAEIVKALARFPGLIPVDLDVERRTVIWQDLGAFHCYDGFFTAALRLFTGVMRARHGESSIVRFETGLDVLDSDDVLTDCLWPTGFIFHASRCGSTALVRSLARSRAHIVFGEAEAHNRIWPLLLDLSTSAPSISAAARERYRRLILAMGRRRQSGSRAHIVKFTSFNILLLRIIREVFPDVPALFLYRDPTAIIASLRKRPPAWAFNRTSPFAAFVAGSAGAGSPDDAAYYDKVVARFFESALLAREDRFKYLEYGDLTAEHLPAVLEVLGVRAGSDDVSLMRAQFRYDAKSDFPRREFSRTTTIDPDGVCGGGDDVSAHTRQLYQRMVASDRNIVRRNGV